MTLLNALLSEHIQSQVTFALKEDIGSGDITAQLIPDDQEITATVISREHAVLCGQAWVNEVFAQLGNRTTLTWHNNEGDTLESNKPFLTIKGHARTILTGERTALNFLQTLSYTATVTRQYSEIVSSTQLTILDTRKTLPGMRRAQKYAVTVGGGKNHRMGLYDAFLIKENHIMAAGSIANAVSMAQKIAPGKTIEVETENLEEVAMAVAAGADIIMLDNFSYEDMSKAVSDFKGQVKFEASGNMDKDRLLKVAETGVDFVSIGALTKHIQAIDLSLRVSQE
ncbi:MAG: carboxylating nicotinate-nucleotide diphosphorylase [Gammaproteobacteria bacterium]|nr:carboxylating nicotinate-nucleotide diphosphorylase [Gammaproteobacteria bacterium]MBU1468240.1 carboxylating nicotinate-nucleotide diphosphorylase [Gammaproteobacteria bacterium]MBU2023753.1 carboxylating nicotinate-nucleotide diphosphorylase [Gammaproteobacteria bacterium]MBU2236661.1 carboxylating nicotinate-nucleotide diphosphorylase [Gammaproteobacteria bacterium]MBU2318919.1 carboxylating nicotinate-nucleotide diphosphorylase [Gammaproteobacteria bacterium]